MQKLQTKAEILINKEIAPGHFKMALCIEGFAGKARPGQFLHIRAGAGYEPLLRRPISVHRISDRQDIVELLYKVNGKGTQLMSRRSKGTFLDVIGPLGNGFKVPKGQSNFVLIAGGMGVAPLVALADRLATYRKKAITVIIGAKDAASVVCVKEFQEIGAKVIVVTEDGSRGDRGLATAMLEKIIGDFDIRKASLRAGPRSVSDVTIGDYAPEVGLYACGPMGMLASVAKIVKPYKIKTQGSFEERMGCGVGACFGCAIKTQRGYERVCKEGPVFDLADIVWD
ncbi:MAG: dihydroorotate dehydrogenase electron transfer subunit [Candidatus Omnitrophica bacterium]|nr:dihydroorotate dehydrogenase electron transfer subunit [Candidatus Omnitrophota bacterium]